MGINNIQFAGNQRQARFGEEQKAEAPSFDDVAKAPSKFADNSAAKPLGGQPPADKVEIGKQDKSPEKKKGHKALYTGIGVAALAVIGLIRGAKIPASRENWGMRFLHGLTPWSIASKTNKLDILADADGKITSVLHFSKSAEKGSSTLTNSFATFKDGLLGVSKDATLKDIITAAKNAGKTDITEINANALPQALKESKELKALGFKNNTEGIFTLNQDGIAKLHENRIEVAKGLLPPKPETTEAPAPEQASGEAAQA